MASSTFSLLVLLFLSLLSVSFSQDTLEQEALQLINQARRAENLPPLTFNQQLYQSAKLHAQFISSTGSLTTVSKDGTGPGDRAIRAGYPSRVVAESVAMGYRTASALVNSWVNSPSHRANILKPSYKDAAVARTEFFWVLDLGQSLTETGSTVKPESVAAMEKEALELINAARKEVGIPPLAFNGQIYQAVKQHSESMRGRATLTSLSPNGQGAMDRVKATGYNPASIGENVAHGQTSPLSVVTAWLRSPSHKANLLSTTFSDAAVGLSASEWYWTVNLASSFRGPILPSQPLTLVPSQVNTVVPTQVETSTPSQVNTVVPTQVETSTPSQVNTVVPTQVETSTPSQVNTVVPTQVETSVPSQVNTIPPTQITTTNTPTTVDPSLLETTVIDLINSDRAKLGRPPLSFSPQLYQAAKKHTNWMAQAFSLSNIGEGGSTFQDRAVAAGYNPGPLAQNVAYGSETGQAVYQSWNDQGQKFFLNAEYKDVAVAVETKTWFWTLLVGSPAANSSGSGNSARLEDEVVALINAARVKAGLPALVFNNKLQIAATLQSEAMLKAARLDFVPDGNTPYDRALTAGYDYLNIAANIAQGYTTAPSVANLWIQEGTALTNTYTEIAVGVSSTGLYWTLILATPFPQTP